MLENAVTYPMVPVVDLDRAKDFYVNKLGLKVMDGPAMDGILSLKTNHDTQIVLYKRAQTKADHTVVAFLVDDVKATVDEMNKVGITFEQYDMGDGWKTDEHGIMSWDNNTVAWFKDTEGNILSLNNKD